MHRILLVIFLLLSTQVRAEPIPDIDLPSSIDWEASFQKIMADPQPSLSLESQHIGTLLTALYRIEADIDDFELELNEQVKKVESDPKFHAHPMESGIYQDIQVLKMVSQQLESKIVYIYQRLVQTALDTKASSGDRAKAQQAVTELNIYLRNLALEDQLQFSRLIQDLRQVPNAETVSPSAELPNVDESDFALFQSIVRAAAPATRSKSKVAAKVQWPALDAAIQKVQTEQRTNKHPFTPIEPGVGPNGNVDGTEFADGVWSLTFDDGPDRRYSSPLMDALLAHRDVINTEGAPASFFWLAENVKMNPAIVKKAVDNHFSTNCHSWTHPNLAKKNHAVRVHEVTDAVNYERGVYGHDFRFYRCPGGACISPAVPEVRQMIASAGLIHAFWSVDSLDWKVKNAKRAFNIASKQMKIQKHGIVLMHDIHPFSLAAAKMLLAWIAEQNNSGQDRITLYTLDDAVDLYNRTSTAISAKTKP